MHKNGVQALRKNLLRSQSPSPLRPDFYPSSCVRDEIAAGGQTPRNS